LFINLVSSKLDLMIQNMYITSKNAQQPTGKGFSLVAANGYR